MKLNKAQWTSQLGFILAAIGSAVGLGNIWRFPYIMGENGGAVFLLVYLIFIGTICFVPLVCELALGKFTRRESVGAFIKVNKNFQFFGWLNVIACFLICTFYFVVGGWILNYIYVSLFHSGISDYPAYFSNFIANPVASFILMLLFISMCSFFIFRGVNKGIEAANKIMMPVFAVILIALAIFSLNLPNSVEGLKFMFAPDFSKFSGKMLLAALGQALFTLSIGMGAILTYGSYLKKEADIVKNSYVIIVADTIFAILAGVMIFPAVFSFGLEPNSGAGLVFITLPQIFAQMHHGTIVGFAFFILLFFAALTSGISILEVQVASLINIFKISRRRACIIASSAIALVGLPTAMSFGLLSNFKIFGKTIFDLFDFVTSNIMLPFNTLVICIVVGWFLNLEKDYLFKNEKVYNVFNFTLKYILPVILVILLVYGLL